MSSNANRTGTSSMRTSLKPAPSSSSRVRSALAMLKIPVILELRIAG
jgi:hypothetical protein